MRFRAPRMAATIERRLLINYRLDPGVARTLLPQSLRPQLVDGSAVAGVCLMRLGDLRPAWVRPSIGWSTENAAHRIAVEWDDETGTDQGVYIPQRHSASWLPVLIGGRLFPGVQKHARFETSETDDRLRLSMSYPGGAVKADVAVTPTFTSGLFGSLEEVSSFFQRGSIGWSPGHDGATLEGLRLETTQWSVEAGSPISVESSFFDALPPGSAQLDSAVVMRGVPITWSVPAGVPGGASFALNAPAPH